MPDFQLRKLKGYCKGHNGGVKVRCYTVCLEFILLLYVCSVEATLKLP